MLRFSSSLTQHLHIPYIEPHQAKHIKNKLNEKPQPLWSGVGVQLATASSKNNIKLFH